jgi:isopenicillin N synthase-like dioxygenase
MNTMFTSPSVAESIKQRGWALIPVHAEDMQIKCEKVIAGWNEFLSTPDTRKQEWTISTKDVEGVDNGYVSKNGGMFDFKEYFHYRPHLPALLDQQGVNPDPHRQWLVHCDVLFRTCRKLAGLVAEELNKIMPGHRFESMMEHPFAECHHVLRLLSYTEPPIRGKQLAKFHVDRNFLTLHVWENVPGLGVTQLDGIQFDYAATDGSILTFPSAKAQILTEGVIPGRPHGVVGREEGDVLKKRQSIVFFAHVARNSGKI